MGVPARLGALGPSRSVEYRAAPRRSPPAIHSSFSQPARPTDCQCPTVRRTVCTQKRSGSPSLPPYRPPARTLSRRHPTSPFLVTHGRLPSFPSLTLRFCLPFSLALHIHAQVVLSFPLEIFSLSVRSARRFFASHSVPSRPLLALLCQSSYTRRTHEHRLSLSPSARSPSRFSPSCVSSYLSLSLRRV